MTPFQMIGWLVFVISAGVTCFMWGFYAGMEKARNGEGQQ